MSTNSNPPSPFPSKHEATFSLLAHEDRPIPYSLSPQTPPPILSRTPRRLRKLLTCSCHPVTLAIPLLLLFFLVASSSLSTNPQNEPLELLEALQKYRDKLYKPPKVQSLDPSLFWVREADEGRHEVTAVMLHGLDGVGDGNQQLGEVVDKLAKQAPWVKWVIPTARPVNVTVTGGHMSDAWYNIKTFSNLYEDEDEKGYKESQREINELLQKERAVLTEQGKIPRIVIGGFSQGAVMALLSVLTSSEVAPIEAGIVLSAYLPLPAKAEEIGPYLPSPMPPLFWGHGRNDPFLTAQLAAQSVMTLQQEPYSLSRITFKLYDWLEHRWNADELDDLSAWFKSNVPEVRVAEAEGKKELTLTSLRVRRRRANRLAREGALLMALRS